MAVRFQVLILFLAFQGCADGIDTLRIVQPQPLPPPFRTIDSGQSGVMRELKLSEDGKFLAASHQDLISVWAVDSLAVEFQYQIQRHPATLQFVGGFLVIKEGASLHMFETENWTKEREIVAAEANGGAIVSFHVSLKRQLAVFTIRREESASRFESWISIQDFEGNVIYSKLHILKMEKIHHVSLVNQGKLLTWRESHRSGDIFLMDLDTNAISTLSLSLAKRNLSVRPGVVTSVFIQESNCFAVSSTDKTVRFVSLGAESEKIFEFPFWEGGVWSLGYDPSRRLVLGKSKNFIGIWRIPRKEPSALFSGKFDYIPHIAVSGDLVAVERQVPLPGKTYTQAQIMIFKIGDLLAASD